MTPSLLLRVLIKPVSSQLVSQQTPIFVGCLQHLKLYNQIRCAGHAKWQNIKNTKQAGDLAKGRLHSRYVLLVRRAVITNNMNGNPKLNTKLAQVLTEAAKFNIPKAILERAIVRALDVQIKPTNVEVQGPGGVSVIVRCETDNVSLLRREIKKVSRKFDANMLPNGTITNMFKSQGFVRIENKTKDGKEIDGDLAEEAGIIANAEEVNLEIYETENGEQSNVWVFSTDADSLDPCKGELEKLGYKVISSELELVPYRDVDFGETYFEKVQGLITALREVDQVIDVYHNAAVPKESAVSSNV